MANEFAMFTYASVHMHVYVRVCLHTDVHMPTCSCCSGWKHVSCKVQVGKLFCFDLRICGFYTSKGAAYTSVVVIFHATHCL